MNRQDLEHALAEGRTVEARLHPSGNWFRPVNPMIALSSGLEMRIVPDGDNAKKIDALIIENEKLKAERNRSGVELRNAVAKAVREEREACANLRGDMSPLDAMADEEIGSAAMARVADKAFDLYYEAIRARSDK